MSLRDNSRWILGVLLVAITLATGCDDLDGRGSNRKGNRQYREGKFVDAAASYEAAIKKVKDDKIEYNIGLAYSKIFKAGADDLILLAEKGDSICDLIPGTEPTNREVCIKNDPDEEDRSYVSCKGGKEICGTSSTCTKADLCAIKNEKLVDLSASHLLIWIEKQPPDEELKKASAELTKQIDAVEAEIKKAEEDIERFVDAATGAVKDKDGWNDTTQRKAAREEKAKILRDERDEVELKFKMRELMTQLWLDSQNFKAALDYWTKRLDAKPTDVDAMGILAGINLKSGDWRKSIEWYGKVAEASDDTLNKIQSYGFIGNVAWSKLNSKTLPPDEALDLADLGIAALQKAAALAPKNLRFLGTQASIYNFRSLTHGGSVAAFIDRASSQDLKGLIDVVSGKAPAKPAVPVDPKAPASPENPTTPAPAKGSAAKSNG
jgi:tetratricopeptide (TPR) repeat protein